MISFHFEIGRAFINSKSHPITVPKHFYGDIEKEGLATEHQEISIICPNGAKVSGYIYSSSAGFGPFYQIGFHPSHGNPVESLKIGDRITVEIKRNISDVIVTLSNHSETSIDIFPTLGLQSRNLGKAVDFDVPTDEPERYAIQVNRIIRDTKLATEIKELYNYICQLCGYCIEFEDGRRYAEAHHVKPLGSPHNGHDSQDNILCLCPNCHAKLDFGIIKLDSKKINSDDQHHAIKTEYIEYHNTHIFRKL